jgi:hypothetical protein
MRKILIIIFFGIWISNCKKESVEPDVPVIKINGKVLNSGTKLPIEGVWVYLTDGYPSGGFLDTGDKHRHTNNRDSSLTDSSGYYKLSIHAYEPVLSLYKEGYSFEYHFEGAVIGIVPLNPGLNYADFNLEMNASAFFDPIFQNKYKNEDDILKFFDINPDTFARINGFDDKVLHLSHFGYSPFRPYEDYPMPVVGDKYHIFLLEIERSGKEFITPDSVYIKSFTTYTDTIFY